MFLFKGVFIAGWVTWAIVPSRLKRLYSLFNFKFLSLSYLFYKFISFSFVREELIVLFAYLGTKYDLDHKSPNKSGQNFKSGEDMIDMYKELCEGILIANYISLIVISLGPWIRKLQAWKNRFFSSIPISHYSSCNTWGSGRIPCCVNWRSIRQGGLGTCQAKHFSGLGICQVCIAWDSYWRLFNCNVDPTEVAATEWPPDEVWSEYLSATPVQE